MIVPPRMIQKVFLLDFINPLTIVSDLQKQVFAIPHGTSNMQNTAIRTCELTFWFSSRDHSQRFSLDPDRIVDRGAVHAGSSAAVHVEIMFISITAQWCSRSNRYSHVQHVFGVDV